MTGVSGFGVCWVFRRPSSMAATARTAGTTTAGRLRSPSAAAHHSRATDGHAADRLATVGMLRECGVLHALAYFKALRRFAFKLGDGFVNVGGHDQQGWGSKYECRMNEAAQGGK
jgi:hypothetical protein